MSKKDETTSTDTPRDETKEKSNVLKLRRPECAHEEDDDEDCPGCSGCNMDCDDMEDRHEVSAEPVLEVAERVLDMLAALAQYRKVATKPEHPAVRKTEHALLDLLDVAADDLGEIRIGMARDNGDEE